MLVITVVIWMVFSDALRIVACYITVVISMIFCGALGIVT